MIYLALSFAGFALILVCIGIGYDIARWWTGHSDPLERIWRLPAEERQNERRAI